MGLDNGRRIRGRYASNRRAGERDRWIYARHADLLGDRWNRLELLLQLCDFRWRRICRLRLGGTFQLVKRPCRASIHCANKSSGSIVPGTGFPPSSNANSASVPIVSGGPVWPELGPWSGSCFATGCGYTGWFQANYVVSTTGNYYLKVGVVNWIDQLYDSELAVDGVTIGGVPITASLPCTPVQSDSGLVCPDTSLTPPADIDPSQEGGQLGSTCNNGFISGIIPGGHVTPAGPNCKYQNCEFSGNLTINGQVVTIDNCQIDGNLTVTAGTLSLGNSHVLGNVQISLASTFNVGPSTNIDGNLTIQSLGPNDPGTVCYSQIKGNVTVQNNSSQLQIGEPAGRTNCPGNISTAICNARATTPFRRPAQTW